MTRGWQPSRLGGTPVKAEPRRTRDDHPQSGQWNAGEGGAASDYCDYTVANTGVTSQG